MRRFAYRRIRPSAAGSYCMGTSTVSHACGKSRQEKMPIKSGAHTSPLAFSATYVRVLSSLLKAQAASKSTECTYQKEENGNIISCRCMFLEPIVRTGALLLLWRLGSGAGGRALDSDLRWMIDLLIDRSPLTTIRLVRYTTQLFRCHSGLGGGLMHAQGAGRLLPPAWPQPARPPQGHGRRSGPRGAARALRCAARRECVLVDLHNEMVRGRACRCRYLQNNWRVPFYVFSLISQTTLISKELFPPCCICTEHERQEFFFCIFNTFFVSFLMLFTFLLLESLHFLYAHSPLAMGGRYPKTPMSPW